MRCPSLAAPVNIVKLGLADTFEELWALKSNEGHDFALAGSMPKFYVSEVAMQTCANAIQVLGSLGFTNVYGRMTWDQVSPTITGGCTTPCKGRFGHLDKRRYTISVREAALLQTFPEKYRFRTDKMEAVCEQIGNAVPPLYAKIVGRKIAKVLKNRDPAKSK